MIKQSLLCLVLMMCLVSTAYTSYSQVTTIREDFARIEAVSNQIVQECVTDEEKVLALSQFAHDKLKPDYSKGIPPNALMSTMDRIDSGVGWCNHQVAIFMKLAEMQGIHTRMLYLVNNEKTASPHTIGEAYINGRWVIIDPQLNLSIRNPNGDLISIDDIKNIPSVKHDLWQFCREEMPQYEDDYITEFVGYYTNENILVYELGGEQ